MKQCAKPLMNVFRSVTGVKIVHSDAETAQRGNKNYSFIFDSLEAEAAEEQYDSVKSKVRDLRDRVDELKRKLETDYGPDQSYAKLEEFCWQFNADECAR